MDNIIVLLITISYIATVTLLQVKDVIMSGSVEDVYLRLAVLREIMMYCGVSSVQVHHPHSNTGGGRLLSVHPWSCLGAAGVVTDTNVGLQSQGAGGVVFLAAHDVMIPLLSYI